MGSDGPHTDVFNRHDIEPLLRRILHLERVMALQGATVPDPSDREAGAMRMIAAYAPASLYEGLPETSTEQHYNRRLKELDAAATDENITPCEESKASFRKFVSENQDRPVAGLVMSDEGHICAVWRTMSGGQAEVEFLRNGQGKLIIFGPAPHVSEDPQAMPELDAKMSILSPRQTEAGQHPKTEPVEGTKE